MQEFTPGASFVCWIAETLSGFGHLACCICMAHTHCVTTNNQPTHGTLVQLRKRGDDQYQWHMTHIIMLMVTVPFRMGGEEGNCRGGQRGWGWGGQKGTHRWRTHPTAPGLPTRYCYAPLPMLSASPTPPLSSLKPFTLSQATQKMCSRCSCRKESGDESTFNLQNLLMRIKSHASPTRCYTCKRNLLYLKACGGGISWRVASN